MKRAYTMFELVFLLCLVIGIGGYVANIVRLCSTDFEAPYKAEVIRGVGVVVPPLGVVLGFVPIADGK
jgi:hypothetical protein